MDDTDRFEARLRAVERALVDGEAPGSIAEAAELAARVESLEEDLDALADRLLTVEAATCALRGVAGQLEHVNREVERRADAALAAVEALDARGEGSDGYPPDGSRPSADSRTGRGIVGTDAPDGAPTSGGRATGAGGGETADRDGDPNRVTGRSSCSGR